MRIIIFVFYVLIFFTSTLSASAISGGRQLLYQEVPAPQLKSPTTEIVDLTGKDTLEFKWSPHESTAGYKMYNDFRIYKGYDTVEKALILKLQVKPHESSAIVVSKTFQDGEVYTWSLKFVFS